MRSKQLSAMQSQVPNRPSGIFYKAKLIASGIFIMAAPAFGQKAAKEPAPDTVLLNRFKLEYKQAMEKRSAPVMRLEFLLSTPMPSDIPEFFALNKDNGDKVGVLTRAELETLKEKGWFSIPGKYLKLHEGTIYVFSKFQ